MRIQPALALVCLLASSSALMAQEYKLKVVASGLARPTGLAVDDDILYFTEVPKPGIAGSTNAVKKLDLEDGLIQTLHLGEPEPVNIVVGRDGTIYWVCKSAGVILKQDENGVTTAFLTGLHKPSGIAISKKGVVYFTEVPTQGMAGGLNGVFSSADGKSIQTIHVGEPEPVDVAVAANGDLYWTCRSAGVILVRSAKDGMVRVLLSGLKKPTGITIDRKGRNLYYTEVPTPGVAGAMGGMNRVVKYDLKMRKMTVVNLGDPEPTDIAVDSDGTVYWTCTSAGVIVQARPVRHDDEDKDE
jgi:streptogramin lyase